MAKQVKALETVWYAGREYQAGETFTPETDLDGESLTLLQKAEYVGEEAKAEAKAAQPAPQPAPQAKPDTSVKPMTMRDYKPE